MVSVAASLGVAQQESSGPVGLQAAGTYALLNGGLRVLGVRMSDGASRVQSLCEERSACVLTSALLRSLLKAGFLLSEVLP
jgi:hypothetical protein